MFPTSVEDGVTTNEFYYLLLVLFAFGAFAVGTGIAMIQYRAWRRRVPVRAAAAAKVPVEPMRRAA